MPRLLSEGDEGITAPKIREDVMTTIIKGLCIAVMTAGMVMGGIGTGQNAGAADAGKAAPRALVKTKYGEIEIKLYPDVAPKHVENFVKLAKSGFYNGTIFHRVIPGFMIQGGDPNTKDLTKKDTYGMGGPKDDKGNPIFMKAEFSEVPHRRGIVSMARRGDSPDTAGSQFFIVVEDSRFLDRQYSVFGEVTKGIGVADKIVNLPRDQRDNPIERVEMSVTILE